MTAYRLSETAELSGVVSTPFAALNVLDGRVIGRCMRRHRHQEFIRFLNAIEASVPARRLIHAIADNGVDQGKLCCTTGDKFSTYPHGRGNGMIASMAFEYPTVAGTVDLLNDAGQSDTLAGVLAAGGGPPMTLRRRSPTTGRGSRRGIENSPRCHLIGGSATDRRLNLTPLRPESSGNSLPAPLGPAPGLSQPPRATGSVAEWLAAASRCN